MMRWILGSVALAIALLLAFVVLEQNPARAVEDGYYYSGAYERPTDLNPFTTTEQVTLSRVLPYTHDALLGWDPETGKLRDALATVERKEDGVTFVFTLRKGLLFSDGSPVSMEDVLFTWEVCSDPTVPLGTMHGDLSGVTGVSVLPAPERLQVVLSEPFYGGLETFATRWIVVQKRYFLDEVARLAGRPLLPGEPGFGEWIASVQYPGPGTGPYRIEDQVLSREVPWQGLPALRLVRNSNSWRRKDCPECWRLDGFELRFFSDANARFSELLEGNLGWYYDPNPAELLADHPELAASYEVYEYDYRNLGHRWIYWNLRRKPFKDVRVRRALSRLFNRAEIVDEYLGGNGDIATAYFKPGSASYPADNPVSFDTQAARELLQAAGFGPEGEPLTVEILAPQEDSFYRRVLDRAAQAFREAGIVLEPRILPFSTVLTLLRDGDFEGVFVQQRHGAWVDPYASFHSSQIENGSNYMAYDNPEVDRILDDARLELDEARRVELYRRFNAIIQEDQPVTFLAHPRASILIDRRIKGVKPGPLGLFEERWWVER